MGRGMRGVRPGRTFRYAAVHHQREPVPLHLPAVPRRVPQALPGRVPDPVRQQVQQRPGLPAHHEPGGGGRGLLRRQRDVPIPAGRNRPQDAGPQRFQQEHAGTRDGGRQRTLHQHRRHGRTRPDRRSLQAPGPRGGRRHPAEARPGSARGTHRRLHARARHPEGAERQHQMGDDPPPDRRDREPGDGDAPTSGSPKPTSTSAACPTWRWTSRSWQGR